MAPPFVACRICYKVEGKVKNYRDDEFYKQAYESLCGRPFDDIQYITKFCPSCATLLRKYYHLRKQCRSNYKWLVEYLDTGRKMTHKLVNNIAERIAKRRSLQIWTVQHATVIDCTHTPKQYKPKQKNEDFYVKHLAVPKDYTEIPIPKVKAKTAAELERELWIGYTCDADYSFDEDDEMSPETSEHPDGVDPMMCVEPVMGMDPVMTIEPGMSVDPVMNMDTAMSVDPVIPVVKIEDGMNVGHLVEVAEETEIVKSDRDPDSLTLQEIKDELQNAGGSLEDLENMKNEEMAKEKRKKGSKKKEKLPKPTKRQIIQAKRLQSNQDLQSHFNITSFLTDEEQTREFLTRTTGEGYREGRFKCDLCLKSFKEQKWIDAHAKKHEPSAGTYVCNICKIRCKTPKLFRTHRDANHTRKFSCKRCPYITYSKAQALKHHGWHEGVEHTCQHCGATFKKHTTYMGHLRRAHPSSYICGMCAGSFVSAYGLNLHIKAVHKDARLEKDSTRCEECDVTFVSHKMYIKHILITDKHNELSKNM